MAENVLNGSFKDLNWQWILLPFLSLLYWRYLLKKYESYLKVTGKSMIKVLFNKGDKGEFKIYRLLRRLEQPGEILLNLYLPKPDGDTTELDVVYLTEYAVFVIESKNYSGWIHGSESQQYWTQTFKNRHKEKFYNPIRQNQGHVVALQQITGLPSDALRPVVVFGDGATLKNINVTSGSNPVLTLRKLGRYITRERNRSPILFNPEEIRELKHKLETYCHADEQTMVQHIKRIKEITKKSHSTGI